MARVILSANPTTHRQWVRQHEDDLLQAAVDFYHTDGRGALVIGWNDYRPRTDEFIAHYFSDLNLQQSGIGWLNQQTAEMVGTYNPSCEFILILINPGGVNQSYAYKVTHANLPCPSAA
jgi:hypothetical protein